MSRVVAIEIADHAIRAAEIKGFDSKKPKLIKTGEIRLEAGVASESTVYDKAKLTEALKQLWENEKFGTRVVALIVSGRRYIVRNHVSGQANVRAIKAMLPFEGSSALPEQQTELVYDFFPIRQFEHKGVIKTEGLVVSAPAAPISDIVFSMTRAKLALDYVEFAPLAITRYVRRNLETENYVLVNIRDESSDVCIVKDGVPEMIRVVSKGLDSEKRKLGRHGTEFEDSLRSDNVTETAVQMLAQDIEMTVKSQSEKMTEKLEVIYISGPRAKDFELKGLLENNLNLQVIPLHIQSIQETKDEDATVEPSFDEFVVMAGGMR